MSRKMRNSKRTGWEKLIKWEALREFLKRVQFSVIKDYMWTLSAAI